LSHPTHPLPSANSLPTACSAAKTASAFLLPAILMTVTLSGPAFAQTTNNQTTQDTITQTEDTFPPEIDNTLDETVDQTEIVQPAATITAQPPSLEDQMGAARRTNIRADVVEPNLRPAIEVDPYEPIGIRIGSFNLTTTIEQSMGYTTNRQNTADGDSGLVSQSIANFRLRSDWSRHSLEVLGNGQYDTSFESQIEPSPSAQIEGRLRLDLIDGYEVTLGAGYDYEQEAASSVNLTQSTVGEPGIHSYGAFAQVERSGHRLGFILRGGIERKIYENAQLASGGTFSQTDRDLTSYILQSRLSYNNNLAFSPFVQANYTTNIYDLHRDRNGQQRDSTSFELRGGFVVNLSEKLVGEISAGYINQQFAEPGLVALSGMVIDSNINWSPQRDTNIELTLASDLASSTNSGDSGAITYQGGLRLTRRIRDNLELNAAIGFEHTNYEGLGQIDTTYNARLGFEHWFNRSLSLTGRVAYETKVSTNEASSYDDATVLLGVKFQR